MNPEHMPNTDANAPETLHAERLAKLLPAWFCERMAFDNWRFGLLLTTGQLLHVETIRTVTQAADGSVWADVELGEPCDVWDDWAAKHGWPRPTHAPTTRRECSVNVAHVVCAVELADT